MTKTLITGGMGFIGFNAALRAARRGERVTILDDLSRRTARRNLDELKPLNLRGLTLRVADLRQARAVERVVRRDGPFDRVLHLGGQVAVTSSVADPRFDFETNALGTLNLLEAVRKASPKAWVLYASTNKVYGGLDWARVGARAGRFFFREPARGVSEAAPLDFHSPYGCSKGAADQYVRDYARIYGMKTAVFRQSCIYGPWQYGEEDQGWVAWFLIAALTGRPITLYGDGRQVRDLLFVDDLLDLYDKACRGDAARGQVFNVGGGPGRTLSLRELLAWIGEKLDIEPRLLRRDWRPGDQRVYVSDVSKARRLLNWKPSTSINAGLEQLVQWLVPRVAKLPAGMPAGSRSPAGILIISFLLGMRSPAPGRKTSSGRSSPSSI